MQSWSETLLSQYADSPTIQGLIEAFNDAIDPSADLQNIYTYLWNISTAVGQGLDNWGQIVGVSRNLQVPSNYTPFGFYDGENSYLPFNQAPFYTSATGAFPLSDDAFRLLILVKALANIIAVVAPSLNTLLQRLFASHAVDGYTRIYALDQGDMKMQITAEFFMEPWEIAVLTQSGAVPRPAGVEATLVQIDVPNTFGFDGSGLTPFNQGTFGAGPISIT